MALQVSCPYCGRILSGDDSLRGKVVHCPGCGSAVQVPPLDQQAQIPRGLPFSPQKPVTSSIATHINVIGILNIVVGILTFLWVLYAALNAFVLRLPTMVDLPQGPPPDEMAKSMLGAMSNANVVMLLLSVPTGILQILAGILILARNKTARTLGIIAGSLGCVSLWTCCAFPFCLGCGIYTLIILFREEVKHIFEAGQPAL